MAPRTHHTSSPRRPVRTKACTGRRKRRSAPSPAPGGSALRAVLAQAAAPGAPPELQRLVSVCSSIHQVNAGLETEMQEQAEKLRRLEAVVEARRRGFQPPLAVAKRCGSRYSCLSSARIRHQARVSISKIPCPAGTLAHDPDQQAVRRRRAMSRDIILPPLPSDTGEALPGESRWVYLPHTPRHPHGASAKVRAQSAGANRVAARGSPAVTPRRRSVDAQPHGAQPGSPQDRGSAGEAWTANRRRTAVADVVQQHATASPLSSTGTESRAGSTTDHDARDVDDDAASCFSTCSMAGESNFVPIPIDWTV